MHAFMLQSALMLQPPKKRERLSTTASIDKFKLSLRLSNFGLPSLIHAATMRWQKKKGEPMFRSATTTKPALTRRASLVETSEQVRIEKAILAELKKGLYLIKRSEPCKR